MFNISKNNIITLTRGDTANYIFDINLGTKLQPEFYNLKDNDTIYLGVMENNQLFENALIRKVFKKKEDEEPSSSILIEFKHNDTIKVLPGDYWYEIKLHIGDTDEIITLVQQQFIIL